MLPYAPLHLQPNSMCRLMRSAPWVPSLWAGSSSNSSEQPARCLRFSTHSSAPSCSTRLRSAWRSRSTTAASVRADLQQAHAWRAPQTGRRMLREPLRPHRVNLADLGSRGVAVARVEPDGLGTCGSTKDGPPWQRVAEQEHRTQFVEAVSAARSRSRASSAQIRSPSGPDAQSCCASQDCQSPGIGRSGTRSKTSMMCESCCGSK